MELKIFWNVKWAERQFLISIYEQNNEMKYSVSIATWSLETNFHLDIKCCMEPNKTININRFQIFESSFKLSLNMDLKIQYGIMKEDTLNL